METFTVGMNFFCGWGGSCLLCLPVTPKFFLASLAIIGRVVEGLICIKIRLSLREADKAVYTMKCHH